MDIPPDILAELRLLHERIDSLDRQVNNGNLVYPADFHHSTGATIIVGNRGSGKTKLCQQILKPSLQWHVWVSTKNHGDHWTGKDNVTLHVFEYLHDPNYQETFQKFEGSHDVGIVLDDDVVRFFSRQSLDHLMNMLHHRRIPIVICATEVSSLIPRFGDHIEWVVFLKSHKRAVEQLAFYSTGSLYEAKELTKKIMDHIEQHGNACFNVDEQLVSMFQSESPIHSH